MSSSHLNLKREGLGWNDTFMPSQDMEDEITQGTGGRKGFIKGKEEARIRGGQRELCPENQRRQTLKEESGKRYHRLVQEAER